MQGTKTTDTRERLLHAGIKIFAQKGYRQATVRQICKQAESSNINSINYYFGSKEELYKEILDKIFSHYDKFDQQDWEKKSPQEQLRAMITNFCNMLYKDNAFTSDITSIFITEMTRPSPFLEDLVDTYNQPRVKILSVRGQPKIWPETAWFPLPGSCSTIVLHGRYFLVSFRSIRRKIVMHHG